MAKKQTGKAKELPKAKKNGKQLKIISVIIAFAFVITLVKCGHQLVRLADLQKQKAEYQTVYEVALKKQETLADQRTLLDNDTYLQRQAKEKFGLVRPDEYVILPAEENEDVSVEKSVPKSDIH